MEPFELYVNETNHHRTLLATTVFILWVLNILKRVELLCSIRIYCFVKLSYRKNTERLSQKDFRYGHQNVIDDRCNAVCAEFLSVPNNSKKSTRSLDEPILKLKNVLLPSGLKILENKSQYDLPHTDWLDCKNKLSERSGIFSLNIMEYLLNRVYKCLPGKDVFGFHKETSEKRVAEYTIAYHIVQQFQHTSSSGSSSFVSNSALQSTSKPAHRSKSENKQPKAIKAASKHNPKKVTSSHLPKIKSITSKAKDLKTSSTTKSSTRPKTKNNTKVKDSVNRESNIKSRKATVPKFSLKKEKIISSVGPTASMCYITTTKSSTSFAKPLVKLPKKKSITLNQDAKCNAASKTNKKVSSKKLKKTSSNKESHSTKIINPSLMMLLPDDVEHHSLPKANRPEVYRPSFCKSLQTIPEDKSVNLMARQLPGNDYVYGYQPHFWSLPNDCFRYTWPMLSQPLCQQRSCPYVAPYQARPVAPVAANCQNVAGVDKTPSQIFFLANHLDTTRHTPNPSNEKGKSEKHKKKKGDKKKHSKTKKK